MPRPKLHSDSAVLAAALAVLLRKGPAHFTLSDVAGEVGISRAALIQRFGDKSGLHHRVRAEMTREVHAYFDGLDSARFGHGLAPLWEMLRDLIAGMGAGENTPGYLLLYWGDVQEPRLRRLALESDERVRREIATRLPASPHDPAVAASLIHAVIQGACMQWLICREGRLVDFMIGQTRKLLQVLYPGHNFA